jgi:CheY-like chemotaxis protein
MTTRTKIRVLIADDHAVLREGMRNLLEQEKDFEVGHTSLVPYVNVEPYYDTRYKTVNRVRLVGGATQDRHSPSASSQPGYYWARG